MSDDMKQLAQRVLDLDAQATDRVWIPWITRDADEDNEWIATSSCHTSDEAQARRDAALIAEYRTAAPDLARALVAEQARSADLERQLAAANARAEAAEALLAGAREDRASAEAIALTRHETISALRADLARVTADRDELAKAIAVFQQETGDIARAPPREALAEDHGRQTLKHGVYITVKRAEKAEADLARVTQERDTAREMLKEARERLLDGAAVLHRDVLVHGSEKADRAANRLRECAAKIDASAGEE